MEFDDSPGNLDTTSNMSEELEIEDSISENKTDTDKEESKNVTAKTDTEEDVFSDALGSEDILTSDEHIQTLQIPEHENVSSSSSYVSFFQSLMHIEYCFKYFR